MKPARGFSIVEALMALAIIGIVITVMLPVVMTRIREQQLSTLKSTLENVQTGLINFDADVGKFPLRLQYLSNAPSGVKDICNQNTITGGSTGLGIKWRGPYIVASHVYRGTGPDTIGLAVADWVLRDSLQRTPLTPTNIISTTGRLAIEISPNLSSDDATDLNTLIDGTTVPPRNGTADTAGAIRWTSITSGFAVSTTFGFVIAGC